MNELRYRCLKIKLSSSVMSSSFTLSVALVRSRLRLSVVVFRFATCLFRKLTDDWSSRITPSLSWNSFSRSTMVLRRLGGDSKELSTCFGASFGGMN